RSRTNSSTPWPVTRFSLLHRRGVLLRLDDLHFQPVGDLNNFIIRFRPCLRAFARQLLSSIIPMQFGDLEVSFFIGVGRAVIGVEVEICIGAGIYPDSRNLLLL